MRALVSTSIRWDELISFVIHANLRKYDHSFSMVSPSLKPILWNLRGPKQTWIGKNTLNNDPSLAFHFLIFPTYSGTYISVTLMYLA